MTKAYQTKPEILTERIVMKIPGPECTRLMLDYCIDNRDHLSLWEPERQQDYYTLKHWQKSLTESEELFECGVAIKFAAMNKEKTEIIGVCNFTNIVQGPFRACYLGFSVSHRYQSHGYMFEITNAALDYIFSKEGPYLHRVMANYIPSNKRSEELLSKLGFEREGYARSYLKIAGKWQDHVLTSRINNES